MKPWPLVSVFIGMFRGEKGARCQIHVLRFAKEKDRRFQCNVKVKSVDIENTVWSRGRNSEYVVTKRLEAIVVDCS